jgi:streptomycin 6-kinase
MPGVPSGAVQRLTEHYGAGVRVWLREVPELILGVAARWGIVLAGYHDEGWTSVVAAGQDRDRRPVVIKISPDTARFWRERVALEHWAGQGVCRMLDADDDSQALLLASVAGRAGGAARPQNHQERVARTLARLHEQAVSVAEPVPLLSDYYSHVVIPRISRRANRWSDVVGPTCVARAMQVSEALCQDGHQRFMLHADLYAENVLFDGQGEPVLIDPNAKIGSAAFDWAFWCVYYVPTGGFADRVRLCRQHAPDKVDEVVAWALTLAVDGALYYLDTGDPTAAAMLSVLDSQELAVLSLGR